jgi:hypothetical protein
VLYYLDGRSTESPRRRSKPRIADGSIADDSIADGGISDDHAAPHRFACRCGMSRTFQAGVAR